jgi:hypothetical protein
VRQTLCKLCSVAHAYECERESWRARMLTLQGRARAWDSLPVLAMALTFSVGYVAWQLLRSACGRSIIFGAQRAIPSWASRSTC